MKRFLMPAAAMAAMKKVAFAILCGAALMIVAARLAPSRAAMGSATLIAVPFLELK